MNKKINIIIIATIFFVLDIIIGLGLIWLWFWLFDNKFMLIILITITIISSTWYAVKQISWAENKIKEINKK